MDYFTIISIVVNYVASVSFIWISGSSLFSPVTMTIAASVVYLSLLLCSRFVKTKYASAVTTALSFMATQFVCKASPVSFAFLFIPLTTYMLGVYKKDDGEKIKPDLRVFLVCIAFIIARLTLKDNLEPVLVGYPGLISDLPLLTCLAIQIYMIAMAGREDGEQIARIISQTKEDSQTDPLTGLLNKRTMERFMTDQAKAYGSFAVIMIDIDNFKKVNDTYGHTRGDMVLKDLAKVMKENVRSTDRVFRYGGEEMCIICPKADLEIGAATAERIRKAFNALEYDFDGDIKHFSISLGVSESKYGQFKDVTDQISKSDAALYEAKGTGKNKVVKYRE